MENIKYLSDKLLQKKRLIKEIVKSYPPWGYFSDVATYAPGLPVQALALAGVVLNDSNLIVCARECADKLFVHLAISSHFMYSDKTWYHWRKKALLYPFLQ